MKSTDSPLCGAATAFFEQLVSIMKKTDPLACEAATTSPSFRVGKKASPVQLRFHFHQKEKHDDSAKGVYESNGPPPPSSPLEVALGKMMLNMYPSIDDTCVNTDQSQHMEHVDATSATMIDDVATQGEQVQVQAKPAEPTMTMIDDVATQGEQQVQAEPNEQLQEKTETNVKVKGQDNNDVEATMIDSPKITSSLFGGDDEPMEQDYGFQLRNLWQQRQPRRLTNNLMEGLDFVHDFLLLTKDIHDHDDSDGFDLESLAHHLSTRTTSIAFAGVGAHDVVDRLLAQALGEILGRHVSPPKSLWHIEYNSSCQSELLLLHDHTLNPTIYKSLDESPCLFGDIHSFWRPEVVPIIEELRKKPWLACETLADLLVSERAVRRSGWCMRHKRYCKISTSDRHSSGSVCTAYSSQGLHLGLSDPSVLSLLAWFLGIGFIFALHILQTLHHYDLINLHLI